MKFLILKIVKLILLPFGLLYEAIKGEKNEIVILMYHRVNDSINKELSVKEKNFKRQMEYLKKKKYQVISMDEAERKIKNRDIRGKTIVLTFDDGYEDFYTNSFPVLKKHGYPSIVYIVPGYIGTAKVFPWDKDIGESRLMDWAQILELYKSGLVDFGSHTQNHRNLDTPDIPRAEDELLLSKQTIGEKLGKEVRHFAYPKGIPAKACEHLVRNSYATGVLIFDGETAENSLKPESMARLKRYPVQRSDGSLLFPARINGWLILEGAIKKLLSKH